MIETIKEIILDSQLLQFDIGLQRHLEIKPLKGKAATCIGVRRSGKSTYLYQIMDKLIASGISPRNILYINFFDDRLYNLQHESLSLILEAYFSIYPEKKSVEQIYCFFDEIQIIPEWESFISQVLTFIQFIAVITTAFTFHQGFGSAEFNIWIYTFTKTIIPGTMQGETNIRRIQFFSNLS